MTDLEITRLCAEVMGCKWKETADGIFFDSFSEYTPLHDDAQAMALVKKKGLQIRQFKILWQVEGMLGDGHGSMSWKPIYSDMHQDLNRAICECVAKMQAAKA